MILEGLPASLLCGATARSLASCWSLLVAPSQPPCQGTRSRSDGRDMPTLGRSQAHHPRLPRAHCGFGVVRRRTVITASHTLALLEKVRSITAFNCERPPVIFCPGLEHIICSLYLSR